MQVLPLYRNHGFSIRTTLAFNTFNLVFIDVRNFCNKNVVTLENLSMLYYSMPKVHCAIIYQKLELLTDLQNNDCSREK